MLEDAILLTELEFERRIQSVEVCTDGFNAVNYAIDGKSGNFSQHFLNNFNFVAI